MTTANLMSACEVAAQTAAGRLSCEDVARACLDRFNAREPVVKAWVTADPDLIMAQARALDGRKQRGPLHGVPVGIKDIILTSDMPTQMGSPIYRGYRSKADASCVALLRAAGALIFGKTVTCEFAHVAPGETTNPHDKSRTPGGSSSGSAAAVADFMVPVAFGTQTAGSVQRPSSFCGIVGYKPTFGLISTEGVKPAAESLDTIGLMARTVEDVELTARVLTNSAPVQWLSQGTPVRIGLCRTYVWDSADDATRQALDDAARRLAKAGFSVKEVALPPFFSELAETREIINDFERARCSAYEWFAHREQLSERFTKMMSNGVAIPRDRYVEALQRVEVCRDALGEVFSGVDVLLAPTAKGEAPAGLDYTGDHRFQSLWTQLRTPTVTLPTHAGPNGMPIGVQLIGKPYADNQVLGIARLVFETLGRGPVVKAA